MEETRSVSPDNDQLPAMDGAPVEKNEPAQGTPKLRLATIAVPAFILLGSAALAATAGGLLHYQIIALPALFAAALSGGIVVPPSIVIASAILAGGALLAFVTFVALYALLQPSKTPIQAQPEEQTKTIPISQIYLPNSTTLFHKEISYPAKATLKQLKQCICEAAKLPPAPDGKRYQVSNIANQDGIYVVGNDLDHSPVSQVFGTAVNLRSCQIELV